MTRFRWALITAFLFLSSGAAFAQSNGNGEGKNKLPNGKPFQLLADAIRNLDAGLQQQVARLQAQLDSNATSDLVRQQMIDSLLVALTQHEQRLGSVQVRVDDVHDYLEVVDARLAFLAAQANTLKKPAGSRGAALETLLQLRDSQGAAIVDLTRTLVVLKYLAQQPGASTSLLATAITDLQGQLKALDKDYAPTRTLLAASCPVGNAIRSVGFTGTATCQQSLGPATMIQDLQLVVVPPNSAGARLLTCPEGSYAVGGGFVFTSGSIGIFHASTPATTSAWFVQVYNPSNPTLELVATVNCLFVS